jgi:large subunit ribosomal protein L7/L12
MSEVETLEPALQTISDQLDGLSLLQASKLVKHLETRWGVSAAAPVAAAGGGAAPAAAVEEKTSFNVVLEDGGAEKINDIQQVRANTGLRLKEPKDLDEGAPNTVKQGATKDEAAAMKKQLEPAGAKVKLT